MIIKKYGIKLTRIKKKDIELIRRKRNSSDINKLMHYREFVSPEMQIAWFNSINNIYNTYFIIHYENKKIGLINGKNSNFKRRQSEGGMFIWDKKYWGTVIPALCSVMMSDFTFFVNDFKRNYIKILRSNQNAINYNKQLGYVVTNDFPSDSETQWYVLTKESYLKHIEKIRKGIKIITVDSEPLSIQNISVTDDTEDDLNMLYKPLPAFVKKNVNLVLKREKRIQV
jgi:RimJ/RimL family protein N-acetyltransferase